ncbi:MAG: hypothetical protein JSU69_08265, partial [Candidatus Zixiibacteriota bacterium]
QDYRNALIYYMKRIAQGADERFWSIYYNAAMSALYMADKGGQAMMEDDDLGLDEDDEPVEIEEVDPLEGVDLARLAVEYLEMVTGEFWEKVMSNENNMRTAIKALNMLGSTYLYQLGECTKGVQGLERVLEIDPENCDARKSLGYAYFGGICPNNYDKALRYLMEARTCKVKEVGDQCKDVDLLLWIAQTYHFRAVDRREAKQKEGAKQDFKAAHDTYLEVLKCDPGNKSAIDGRDQVKFEF